MLADRGSLFSCSCFRLRIRIACGFLTPRPEGEDEELRRSGGGSDGGGRRELLLPLLLLDVACTTAAYLERQKTLLRLGCRSHVQESADRIRLNAVVTRRRKQTAFFSIIDRR